MSILFSFGLRPVLESLLELNDLGARWFLLRPTQSTCFRLTFPHPFPLRGPSSSTCSSKEAKYQRQDGILSPSCLLAGTPALESDDRPKTAEESRDALGFVRQHSQRTLTARTGCRPTTNPITRCSPSTIIILLVFILRFRLPVSRLFRVPGPSSRALGSCPGIYPPVTIPRAPDDGGSISW